MSNDINDCAPECAGCENLQLHIDSLKILNHDLTETNCNHVKLITALQKDLADIGYFLERAMGKLTRNRYNS